MRITPEQVEFKELAIGDFCFHHNTFYKKIDKDLGEILSTLDTTILTERQFTSNVLVNIVLNK